MPRPRESLTQIANREVGFAWAARQARLNPLSERGSRDSCPSCGGLGAFRGYTDHGFCHSCRTYFSPVTLLAICWQMEPEDAARRALDTIGFVPVDYAGAWEHANRDPDPDRPALGRALRTWCAAHIKGWEWLQYEDRPARALAVCLGLLPRVSTPSDCDEWMSRCQQVMTRVCGGIT